MTEQEQIEEIAKYVCNVCDFKCTWFQEGTREGSACTVVLETAEAIYNAGYRRIREKDETLEEQNGLKAEIKHLNTIVERLDELLAKGIDEYIMGIDGVEGLKDMWERSAVRAFAEKMKAYINNNADFVYKSECGEYAKINITLFEKYIDELLKEYE